MLFCLAVFSALRVVCCCAWGHFGAGPVRTFSDSFTRDGILKANWLKKHSEVVPSVVVMVTTFCTDWPAGEMLRRQTLVSDQLNHLRNMLAGRETKIFVCLVRTGSGNIDKDMLDDRLTK